MTARAILAFVACIGTAATAAAEWGPPCETTVFEDSDFGRVTSIARCAWTTGGAQNTSVTVSGLQSLTPGGGRKSCYGSGYCGTSIVLTVYEPSTTYTSTATFEASQMTISFSKITVSASTTTRAPIRPRTEPPVYCDDQTNITCDGSPILISATGRYELTGIDDGVSFDIDADGTPDRMSWTAPGSDIAFLALDRNGNGAIDDGGELFGNYARLPDGGRASNGFELLKALDSNGDARIDDSDAVWTRLLLWTDRNHDGLSQAGELAPIAESELAGLGCAYRWTGRLDRHGNAFRWMSAAASGQAALPYYDVYFRRTR